MGAIRATGDFVVLLITILLILDYAWGLPIQDTFFVQGAAAFISIPLNVMAPFAEWGLIFAAAALLLFSKYLGFVESFLGNGLYAFAMVAAVIVLLTGIWTP